MLVRFTRAIDWVLHWSCAFLFCRLQRKDSKANRMNFDHRSCRNTKPSRRMFDPLYRISPAKSGTVTTLQRIVSDKRLEGSQQSIIRFCFVFNSQIRLQKSQISYKDTSIMRSISTRTAHAEKPVRIINKWSITCVAITLYAFWIIWIKIRRVAMAKFDRVASSNRTCHCVQM